MIDFSLLKFFYQLKFDRLAVKQIQQKLKIMLLLVRNGENKTKRLCSMKKRLFLSRLIYSIYSISLKISIIFQDFNFLEEHH